MHQVPRMHTAFHHALTPPEVVCASNLRITNTSAAAELACLLCTCRQSMSRHACNTSWQGGRGFGCSPLQESLHPGLGPQASCEGCGLGPAEGSWLCGAACHGLCSPLHALQRRSAGLLLLPRPPEQAQPGRLGQPACCACWSCPGGQPGAAAGSPWVGLCLCWPTLRAWRLAQLVRPCPAHATLPLSREATAAARLPHGCQETLHICSLPEEL